MEIYKIIGNEIRKIRKEKGFSTQEAAEYLDLKRSSYLNIECGSRKPTLEQLEKLGAMFNCYWEQFFSASELKDFDNEEERDAYIAISEEFIKESEEKIRKRDSNIKELILEAIKLESTKWSLNKDFLSDKEIEGIYQLVYQNIRIRMDQLKSEKEN
ncbi:helix-turn-helix transcriptional regulator [Clostridioides difficile]|uniref:helix-turn-helix transcriptional regulator n=1 Tax=Clostridioides difficile TaxID=1496 RepID=UPI00188D04A2|nr:helix-turn-helix transcriptional regulator [Clostridioides difficile]MBY2486243.1 helix-turn-helix domain-containing protein [Clostridioides difficile]MDF3327432.1 helix-turn-helix transcriptional regulator [Clostridioides difficile]HBF8537285.1 helix-turn-helix transcriptional regulator [Clostridioides difficile]